MRIGLFVLLITVLCASSAIALDVTMTTKVHDDNQLTVSGTTNMPDGTELLVNFCDPDGFYLPQGKVIVTKGTFKTGPFPSPAYMETTLNIISQIADYQPPKVRAVIGDRGEMLDGKLVVKGSFGGRIVSYHSSVNLKRDTMLRGRKVRVLTFNKYSSYCALKATGRKDLPPITQTLNIR